MPTRVFAHEGQYNVVGGADIGDIEDALPGVAWLQGPQQVAVLTGINTGELTVDTEPLAAAPTGVEDGWDVVGELDVISATGTLLVCDWSGPPHPELADLAAAGPGRYRLRIHIRQRSPSKWTTGQEPTKPTAWWRGLSPTPYRPGCSPP